MNNLEGIFAILGETRRKIGISVNEASDALGCSRIMIWKMEHGEVKSPKRSRFLREYNVFLIKKYYEKYHNFAFMSDYRYIKFKKYLD